MQILRYLLIKQRLAKFNQLIYLGLSTWMLHTRIRITLVMIGQPERFREAFRRLVMPNKRIIRIVATTLAPHAAAGLPRRNAVELRITDAG